MGTGNDCKGVGTVCELRFAADPIKQLGYRESIAIVQAVVVDEHALGKALLCGSLHFQMDIQPVMASVVRRYFDQLVDEALAKLGITNNFTQLLLEESDWLRPIDGRMSDRKIEMQEVGEVALNRFFPRNIIIVCHRTLRMMGHHR